MVDYLVTPRTPDLLELEGAFEALADPELCDIVRKAGDLAEGPTAFAELYLRHKSTAVAEAARITADSDHVHAVVSDAFADIFLALRRGGGPTVSFTRYLLAAIRVVALRRGLLRLANSQDSQGRSESWLRLASAFGGLPSHDQQVIWLLEVEGLAVSEASDHLGETFASTRATARRGQQRLVDACLRSYAVVADPACSNAVGRLATYIAGSATGRRRDLVESHLRTCVACRAQVDTLLAPGLQLQLLLGSAVDRAPLTACLGAATSPAPTPHATSRSWLRWVTALSGVALFIVVSSLLVPAVSDPVAAQEVAAIVDGQLTAEPGVAGAQPLAQPSSPGSLVEP